MADHRVMVVLISDTGRVVNAVLEFDREVSEQDVNTLEAHINRHLTGLDLSGVRRERLRLYAQPVADSTLLGTIVDTIVRMLTEEQQDRVFLGGTANLLRQPSSRTPCSRCRCSTWSSAARPLLQLIGHAIELDRVWVQIGRRTDCPTRTTSQW